MPYLERRSWYHGESHDDEPGSTIGLMPVYAWAPQGNRAYGSVPRNRGKNTTLLASLTLSGMGAAMILEGGSDTLTFECYVEQVLAPSLKSGQIVVMDNLSSHLGPQVRHMIQAKGCQLLFLSAYSPDLSTSEEAFSKLKTFLRRVGVRTHQELWQALGDGLEIITPKMLWVSLPIVATPADQAIEASKRWAIRA